MHMSSDTKPSLPSVHLFTDGACSGNPGPGGWAFILRHPKTGNEKEQSGGEEETTNNRMELLAVIRGLESLRKPCHVELFTDSSYVGEGLRSWMAKWKLTDLATLRVVVSPGPGTYEVINRAADQIEQSADIIVQKRVDPEDNATVDPLVELLEELIRHFFAKILSAGGRGIVCMRRELVPGTSAAIDEEMLQDLRTFTGVVRTHWMVRQ